MVDPNPVTCPVVPTSTLDVDYLSETFKIDTDAKRFLKTVCYSIPNISTHNVIAELEGLVYPEKIILIAAHIDGHYHTPGAHDNAAGCVQAMEVIRIFKK